MKETALGRRIENKERCRNQAIFQKKNMYIKIPAPESCPQTNIKQLCQVTLKQLPISLQYFILPAPLIRGLSTLSESDLLSSKQANNTQQILYIEVNDQSYKQISSYMHKEQTE